MTNIFPEPQIDLVPSLVPQQDEPLPADDALARFEDSLDTRPDDEDLIVSADPLPPIGRGWAFDFEKRRFVTGPLGHGPLVTRGISTLRVLIVKACLTARGAHPIYSDNYGIDLPADMLSGPVVKFPADLYAARIKDACVSAHPRIADVIDVRTSADPDQEYVLASFTVVLDDDTQLTFDDVPLGGRP